MSASPDCGNPPITYQTELWLSELQYLLREKSLLFGTFQLASGKTSSWYLDCRRTALSGRGSYLIGALFYNLLAPLHLDAVGGMALGAAPLVTAVTTRSVSVGHGVAMDGFLVRKEAKGHGAGNRIEGNLHPWMRVALLEDVVSTGGSTRQAVEALQTAFPSIQIVQILALVDRNMGGKELFSRLGIPYRFLYSAQSLLPAPDA